MLTDGRLIRRLAQIEQDVLASVLGGPRLKRQATRARLPWEPGRDADPGARSSRGGVGGRAVGARRADRLRRDRRTGMVQYSKDRASRRGHRHRHRWLRAAHHRRGRARLFAHPVPQALRALDASKRRRLPARAPSDLRRPAAARDRVVRGAVTHRARGDRASRRGPRAEGPARGVDVGGALSRVRGVSAARSMAFRQPSTHPSVSQTSPVRKVRAIPRNQAASLSAPTSGRTAVPNKDGTGSCRAAWTPGPY
jgi:hypothetical protein